MIPRIIGFYLLSLLTSANCIAQTHWMELSTVGDVCAAFPERMNKLMKDLDLKIPELAQVNDYYNDADLVKACSALLEYYKNNNNASHLRKELPPFSTKTSAKGDSILQDIFRFYALSDKVPRDNSGHLDWAWEGPDSDIEWAWALNRHYPVRELLSIYSDTRNPKYIRYIDHFIKSWVIESLPYPEVKSSTAMWRGLEASFRVKVWSNVFYQFMDTDLISPATQLLILSSLPEHAHYAYNFHGQNNWLTMEMSGLATLATSWPEFKMSTKWLGYTIDQMTESLKGQVYPDGVQTELASHYHTVALHNFLLFNDICERAGKPLPKFYTDQLENMWNYLAWSIRPDGNGVMNNDSDLDFNRPRVLEAAQKYGRTDWEYLASNGDSGIKPEQNSSLIFPWAGQVVSRNNFSESAHWSFFDIGPWGSGHQHSDKLHISLAAYGVDFLVDGGRFAYRGKVADKFSKYARGSLSHNIILVDGKEQSPGPKLAKNPIEENQYKLTDQYDYAWGTAEPFSGIEGSAEHQRTFFYLKDQFWIVIDKIKTDRPRNIEALWHWNPDFEILKNEENTVFTQRKKGNLFIRPLNQANWKVDLVKGQEKPVLQGWYSKLYNKVLKNYTSVYSTEISEEVIIPWLIVPYDTIMPEFSAQIIDQDQELITIKLTFDSNATYEVSLPLNNTDNIVIDEK